MQQQVLKEKGMDIIIIEWSLWSKTYIVEDSTFLKTDMILVDQDMGFYW